MTTSNFPTHACTPSALTASHAFFGDDSAPAEVATSHPSWEMLNVDLWQHVIGMLPLPAALALSCTNRQMRDYVLGRPEAPLPIVKKLRQQVIFYGKEKPPGYDLSAVVHANTPFLSYSYVPVLNRFKCFGLMVHFAPDATLFVHAQRLCLRHPRHALSCHVKLKKKLAIDWARQNACLSADGSYFVEGRSDVHAMMPRMHFDRHRRLEFLRSDGVHNAANVCAPINWYQRHETLSHPKFIFSPSQNQVACFLLRVVPHGNDICRIFSLGGAQHGHQYGDDIVLTHATANAFRLHNNFHVSYDAQGMFLLAAKRIRMGGDLIEIDYFAKPHNNFYDFAIHVPSGTVLAPRRHDVPARRIVFSADGSTYAALYQGDTDQTLQVGPLTLASLQWAEATTEFTPPPAWLQGWRNHQHSLAQKNLSTTHEDTILCLDADGGRLAAVTCGLNVLIYHLRSVQPHVPQILQAPDRRHLFNNGSYDNSYLLPKTLQFAEHVNALILVSQAGDLVQWNLWKTDPKPQNLWTFNPARQSASVQLSPTGEHAVVMSYLRDRTQACDKPTIELFALTPEAAATSTAYGTLPPLPTPTPTPTPTWYEQLKQKLQKLLLGIARSIQAVAQKLCAIVASCLAALQR